MSTEPEPTVDELAKLYVDTAYERGATGWPWADMTDEQRDAHRLAVGALVNRLLLQRSFLRAELPAPTCHHADGTVHVLAVGPDGLYGCDRQDG